MIIKETKITYGIHLFALILLAVMLIACNNPPSASRNDKLEVEETKHEQYSVPEFNKDSAFHFVDRQVAFGPRVPNTEAHKACANYLEKTLRRFTINVIVQDFQARAFDGTRLNGKNIIASYNPENKSRIMLCAHWDSRPFADHDPDINNQHEPIDGANDGASGVGVLLEIARQLKSSDPRVGVDIIFFDAEDYGPHNENQQSEGTDLWGLGSQYWSKNPHKYNYKARFAILLDMVGVPDPQFLKEGFSMYYAPDKVKKVWDIAHEIGYKEYFINKKGGYITDDHYYINKYKHIPAINIIHLDPNSANGTFFDHWHTKQDDMTSIDKETLGIVGHTVLTVVFRE